MSPRSPIRFAATPVAVACIFLATGTGAAIAGDAPRLVSVRAIALDGGLVPVVLSPDGSRLAAIGPAVDGLRSEVCVAEVATLATWTCSDPSILASGVDAGSLRWSPDGARLAFVEDHVVTGLDGDLWIMDAVTGGLRNVDDDGVSAIADPVLGFPEGTVTLPMAPAFTPDGSALTYGRLVAEDGVLDREEIVTVPIAGGPAEVLLGLPGPPDAGSATYFGGVWAPDGSRFLASLGTDALAEGAGIVAITTDGGTMVTLAGVADPNAGPPAAAAVAADGRHVLGYLHRLGASYGGAANAWLLVDAATGAATAVTAQDELLALYTFIGEAGFSPDGAWLLTVTRGTDPDGQVAVRPVDGGPEVVLVPDGVGPARFVETGLPLGWAADGSVLIPGDPDAGTATLLTIEGGGTGG